MLEHRVNEGATYSTIAVSEWVDRLELRVSHCGLSECRQVEALDEFEEISHCLRYAVLMRRYEASRVNGCPTNAHLVSSPATCPLGIGIAE